MNNRKYIGRCDHCDDEIYDDEKWYEVKREHGWNLLFCKDCVIEHDEPQLGKWVLLTECSNSGVYCSCCQKKVYKEHYANQALLSKYCPNCGRIMDTKDIERY